MFKISLNLQHAKNIQTIKVNTEQNMIAKVHKMFGQRFSQTDSSPANQSVESDEAFRQEVRDY